ncbi:response regulator [Flammeovirga sp. EKP202]|uniref:response regulator n=1 Tax=Flammeovirga sp. EKP202 TaxID=2770592 RepID=UPI00165FC626|nr:response regulator [Flammeovirga sp. EKP202]MBD0399799.1 response regulator [Flammeovirga sp. EKP202]
MDQLAHILLIDDSESINFFNRLIIEDSKITRKCTFFLSAEKGLDYLKQEDKERYPLPNIIFLDINMPRMNGWEFITEYDKLDIEIREQISLFLLTTSINDDDLQKANMLPTVKGYLNKPLSVETIMSAYNLSLNVLQRKPLQS